jgi:hypothetical protein
MCPSYNESGENAPVILGLPKRNGGHPDVRNIEQTAACCSGQSDLSAEEAAGRKGLPNEVVMDMEDTRCNFVEMESENLRYKGVFDSLVIDVEDPRCQNLHNRAVLEIEDSRCRCEGIETEDPRCKNMRFW